MSIASYSNDDVPHGPVSDVPFLELDVEGLTVDVPALLVECFEYILAHGRVEGIFRISGSIKRMRDVTADYGSYATWLDESKPSPHDVSGVTKKFTRDYLHSIGGLFPPEVLVSLRALFASPARKNSMLGSESYRSYSTSYSSGLESVAEENADPTFALHNVPEKLDSLVTLLVTKNLARKNALFIYFLSVLKAMAQHLDQTRMLNVNLAIVFQQYLFETWVMTELQPYQTLLEHLLDNYNSFIVKYHATLALLGGLEEVPSANDNGSVHYEQSLSVSPLTDYSMSHSSPPKLVLPSHFEGRRRSSLSQKFNTFWDSYASPATRSKRLSFMLKSSGKSSSDRLPLTPAAATPDDDVCRFSVATKLRPFFSAEEIDIPAATIKPNPILQYPTQTAFGSPAITEPDTRETSRDFSIRSQRLEQFLVVRQGSRRKLYSAFLLRDVANASTAHVSASTPRLPPPAPVPLSRPKPTESASLDTAKPSFPLQRSRPSLSRRLSLWLKKK